jgi:hypothetical protein
MPAAPAGVTRRRSATTGVELRRDRRRNVSVRRNTAQRMTGSVLAQLRGSGAPRLRAKGRWMANIKESLNKIMQLDGAVGTCIVDSTSGMMLGAEGGNSPVNLEVAAAGNTEVVRAKRKTMRSLNIKDDIEDILITLKHQYHLIRLLSSNDALFIYLILDKNKGNLAMARHQLANIERDLSI